MVATDPGTDIIIPVASVSSNSLPLPYWEFLAAFPSFSAAVFFLSWLQILTIPPVAPPVPVQTRLKVQALVFICITL